MNLKKIDFKMLGAVVLIIAAVVTYWICSTKISEQTQQYSAENASLQTEVDYLQDLMNHKQQYIDETEYMSGEITRIMNEYPLDVKPENQIMYVNDLELQNDIVVEGLTMPGKEMVVVDNPSAASVATDQPVEDSMDAEETPVDDTAATAPAASGISSSVILYRSPTSFSFKVTYKSAKEMLKKICEDINSKKSIETVTLALDAETRNLTGNMTLALYSLDGTEREYEAPNVGNIITGTDNVFKTLDNASLLRTTTSDGTVSGGTETPVDNSESTETSEDKSTSTDN